MATRTRWAVKQFAQLPKRSFDGHESQDGELTGMFRGTPRPGVLGREPLSPPEQAPAVVRTANNGLEAGAQTLWIVDPEKRHVLLSRPHSRKRPQEAGPVTLPVLPGCSTGVAELLDTLI